MFFAGIVVSSGALYAHHADPSYLGVGQLAIIIGLTFLSGLMSIHFTAKSVEQTVVYLDRKQEQEQTREVVADADDQLDLKPIEAILKRKGDVAQAVINELARQLQAGQAALYSVRDKSVALTHGYALLAEKADYTCELGEGLIGRVAKEGNSLYIDKLPEGYITVFSGLGSSSPTYLAIIPLKHGDKTKGVLEIAVFKPLTQTTLVQLENIGKTWASTGL